MKKNIRLRRSDVGWGFAVAGLVILQFWWLPGEAGTSTDSFSNTIDGKLGLYRTLSELFPAVKRDSLQLVPDDSDSVLLLLAPDRYPTATEERELFRYVYNGGLLLFAPNWSSSDCRLSSLGIDLDSRFLTQVTSVTGGIPAPTSPAVPSQNSLQAEKDDEQLQTVQSPDSIGDLLSNPERAETGLRPPSGPDGIPFSESAQDDETLNPPASLQTTSVLTQGTTHWRTRATLNLPTHLTVQPLVFTTESVEVAFWPLGQGGVMVSSSPDVFSNRSLLFENSRKLAVRMVEFLSQRRSPYGSSDAPIIISEYLSASDAYRQTGVLFSPALRIGTLQLIMLAALGMWYGFHRFGPVRTTDTQLRRSLTDSAAATGNLLYQLQDGGAVVAGYLDYLRSQLRRRFGNAIRLEHYDALAARTDFSREQLEIGLRDADRLSRTNSVPPAQAAATLRWLAELQNQLAGTDSRRSARYSASSHPT